MAIKEFESNGYSLREAVDGLIAYWGGCTDSGINDYKLRYSVAEYLKSLDDNEFRIVTAKLARDLYLSEDQVVKGYGLEDVRELVRFLNDLLQGDYF